MTKEKSITGGEYPRSDFYRPTNDLYNLIHREIVAYTVAMSGRCNHGRIAELTLVSEIGEAVMKARSLADQLYKLRGKNDAE